MLCLCLILLKIGFIASCITAVVTVIVCWISSNVVINVTRIINVAIDIVSVLMILSSGRDNVSSDISIYTVAAIVERIARVVVIVKSVLTVINAIQNVIAISTMFAVSNLPIVDVSDNVVVVDIITETMNGEQGAVAST